MASLGLRPGLLVAERYRLEEPLGEGGMGVVWRGAHLVSQRKVALKFLKHANEERARRLLREARIVGRLEQPNVVEVIDAFAENGLTVLVMELLVGETLDARLSRVGALSRGELVEVMVPVIDALAAAHRIGVVHRDLKPANIYVQSNGIPKVLDFGVAKVLDKEQLGESATLTREGALVGTPHYMSPEQVFGEADIDARADMWSLGVVLFECLAGRRPFEAENLGQIIKGITMSDAPLLPIEVDAELRDAVRRLLTRDRARRDMSLAELRELLTRAAPVRVVEPRGRPQFEVLRGVAIAVGVFAMSLAAFSWLQVRRSDAHSLANVLRTREGETRSLAASPGASSERVTPNASTEVPRTTTSVSDQQKPARVPAGVESREPTRTLPGRVFGTSPY
jgi:serine/threonine protein kinase